MTDEIVCHHGTTMVRRLRLAPGEAMPWHRDPFHRVAVVLSGDVLSIEYRDGGESPHVEITPGPGRVGGAERPCPSGGECRHPDLRAGDSFLLDRPDAVAQPTEEQTEAS